jgi:hypothetical protein
MISVAGIGLGVSGGLGVSKGIAGHGLKSILH